MKSLTFKLALAFVVVAIAGVSLVALLIRRSTQRELDRLVLSQNQQALLANLVDYYQQNQGWTGVDRLYLSQNGQEPNGFGDAGRWESRRELFALADLNGSVVFGGSKNEIGKKLRPRDLEKAYPVALDGETVGYLVFLPSIDRWQSGTPEGDFLQAVNRAIVFSALAASLLALVLGGVLARTLTHRLRELTAATQELAKGKLGHQVEVHSEDELGVLAASFNQMSADLKQSTELRRQMTANIAHDLRSPLSVILGYTEALNDHILEPTPEIFGVMHTEARHLNHLIDDLKTLSLADAGELPLYPQPVPVESLLRRTVDAHRVQADQKKISLEVSTDPDLPEIQVDIERMVQVLGNLMNNALRHTPEGGKIVLSGRKASAHGSSRVLIQVSDTGPGIDPDDLPHVFERTYRGDKARGQLEGETGLGLTISHSLVEAQGGTISVQSQPGEGTSFFIEFPA